MRECGESKEKMRDKTVHENREKVKIVVRENRVKK